MDIISQALDPILQQGLLGLCVLQLITGALLVKKLLNLFSELSEVVNQNTNALRSLEKREAEMQQLLSLVLPQLIERAN